MVYESPHVARTYNDDVKRAYFCLLHFIDSLQRSP